MSRAQLMEEELQQSVVLSDEDAMSAQDEEVAGDARLAGDEATIRIQRQNQTAFSANSEHTIDQGGSISPLPEEDVEMDDAGTPDAASDDESGGDQDGDDEDAMGDADEDEPFDAEGEEEDEGAASESPAALGHPSNDVDDDSDGEHDGEDEDEGVGAVKIKPGETDDEDEDEDAPEDSDNSGSRSTSDEESEEETAWDDVVADENEDESDAATGANCIFCKQDEEHDPGEEFETYMACSRCGEHAHQQCAREANAFAQDTDAESWKCPDCVGEDIEPTPRNRETESRINASTSPEVSPTASRSSAPKLARDLLPSQRGGIKPDSHSVFNQLVLDKDPLDGSRLLRKRKSSSVEAEDQLLLSRKRHRTSEAPHSEEENGQPTTSASADEIPAEPPTRPTSSRTLRLKVTRAPLVTVLKKSRTSLQLEIKVKPSELRQVIEISEKKRARRASASRSSRPRSSANAAPAPALAPFISTPFSQPFYSLLDKETDELKGKPYGGILTELEADTSKTLPTPDDRRRFDEAKQKAENQWRQRIEEIQAQLVDVPVKKAKKSAGPASQIECIEFGGWEIDTWYAAPYPEEYSRNRVLYICEFCLKYMNSDYVAWRHKLKCPAKHPPGDEIYRHASVSVFEVDGRKNPVYCQNLCLLAKLFLGSKTLYYDVEPFLFYVLCEYDDLGYHFVGYFSKEKRASSQNNVSCILTLPIHQRKGYGNLLIDFSYLLTRVEQKTGSPEKPLSDMGLVSYRNYWRLIMCRYLLDHVSEDKEKKNGLSIRQISDDTGLTPDDVTAALEGLRCLVRDPQTELYAFRVDLTYCREYVAKWDAKNYVKLNPQALTWTPYVMGRSMATNFELGPAITAIAPREEEDEPKPVLAQAQAQTQAQVVTNGHLPESITSNEEKTNDATVIESTEKNDDAVKVVGDEADRPALSTTPAGEDSEKPAVNGKPTPSSKGGSVQASTPNLAEGGWAMAYAVIPPTRFQIFPAVGATRRVDRPRTTVIRPPVARTASSASRPRRSGGGGGGGSSRKSSAPRPKSSSSSSRRKSGGTGRGPGRWPKGTKKSDYGNADSGPGLPPAWLERQRQAILNNAAAKTDGANGSKDSKTKDVVEVQVQAKTPGSSGRSGKADGKRKAPLEEEVIVGAGEKNGSGEEDDDDEGDKGGEESGGNKSSSMSEPAEDEDADGEEDE